MDFSLHFCWILHLVFFGRVVKPLPENLLEGHQHNGEPPLSAVLRSHKNAGNIMLVGILDVLLNCVIKVIILWE